VVCLRRLRRLLLDEGIAAHPKFIDGVACRFARLSVVPEEESYSRESGICLLQPTSELCNALWVLALVRVSSGVPQSYLGASGVELPLVASPPHVHAFSAPPLAVTVDI
jgi:hypothetical protein